MKLVLLAFWSLAVASGYVYETTYYQQKVDHFNSSDSRTFSQRVLSNRHNFNQKDGPIFFYTGNEGDITWFCNNTGMMWDIAPSYRAMLVFAEHRYYGMSLPFGADSYEDKEHLSYLAVEQVLEDFVQIIISLKKELNSVNNPVVAFGGSYGGMLASWLRMKHPDVVIGALAASAPIWYFTGLTPCNSAFQIITRDFEGANPNCSAHIKQSWSALRQVGAEDQGLQWLSTTFHLCHPLRTSAEVDDLIFWIQDTWFSLAMVDYPYPANFLEPLPAWPINKTCQHLAVEIQDHKEEVKDQKKFLEALSLALSVYYNSTGSATCYNITQTATGNLGQKGWDYQACTEMIMPMCSDGVTDMFTNQPWNLTAYEEECMEKYGVKSQPYKIQQLFGGKNISAHSNIIFSNGLLDPWSGGGVMETISDSLVAVVIPNGAHHLDLRAATPQDPPELRKVRQMEQSYLSKWIKEFRET